MEFKEVVEDRYSCKKFNGEPVAEKALKAILEAGRVAPTAKNLQEQHRRRHYCGYAHDARRKERWRRQLLGELLQPRGSGRKTGTSRK